jgi:hypothetical protein
VSLARETGSKLDMGRVIQQTLVLVGRDLAVLLLMAAILEGLPSVASSGLRLVFGLQARSPALQIVTYVVQELAGGVFQAALIHRIVTGLQGRRATLAQCLKVTLGRIGPLLALGILYLLACAVGLALLLIPGAMLITAWSVTIPAFAAENTGVIGAFRRSVELTRGNRWRIFGLLVLELVLFLVLSWGTTYSFTIGAAVFGVQMPLALYYFAIAPIYYVVPGLLSSGLSAALYIELRQLRDGVGLQGVAAVFD